MATGEPVENSPPTLAKPNQAQARPKALNAKPPYSYTTSIALLLAGVALLLTFYLGYQTWQLTKKQHQQQVINHQLRSDKQTLQQLTTKLIKTTKTLQNSQAKLQIYNHTIDKNLQDILKQTTYQQQDWSLLKARYCIELAQIQAHWGENQQITISLLQQADQVLQNIPNQKVFSIRQAIAQEIAQIKSLPTIDTAGILSQLDAARTMISSLPIQQTLINAQSNKTPSNSETKSWQDKLDTSLDFLKKLVVIRRYEGEIRPLFSPLQQNLLKESLRMDLQEAQWGVLQRNPAVYYQSLNQVLQTIKDSFDTKATNTQALIQQLQELQQKKLTITRPLIQQSLQLINQYIEGQETLPSMPAAGGKSL